MKTYRVEITSASGEKIVLSHMDRGSVRDKVDSILFTTYSRIENIFIRFVDGTRVVIIEE